MTASDHGSRFAMGLRVATEVLGLEIPADPNVEHVRYRSACEELAGDLYLPEGAESGRAPAVVLGHSGAGGKEGLIAAATRFAAAGLAAFAIDYRSFGESAGEPRGVIWPERQVEDVRSAVSYLQTRDEVDPDRIGVWGHSIGGTVVTVAAVVDRRVRCVAVQQPVGWNMMRHLEKSAGRAGLLGLREAMAADWQRRFETGESAPASFGQSPDEVVRSYLEAGQRINPGGLDIRMESMDHMLLWAAESYVEFLSPTPLLIVANTGHDLDHLLDETQRAYARAGEPKRLELLPYDSPGLSIEPGFSEAMELYTAWFDEHLCRARIATRSPKAPGF